MKTLKLYGHLGKKFGRQFEFDGKSPYEAIQFLKCNFKDFSNYILEHNEPGYHVIVDREYKDLKNWTYPISSRETIKIVPIVAGAGHGGLNKIILGAALIAIAIELPGLGTGFSTTVGAANYSAAGAFFVGAAQSIGSALIIGGLSQALFKAPDTPTPKDAPSYTFNGPVNTTAQGNPIPVGYGTLLVGGQVISAAMRADPLPLDANVNATV